MKLIFVIFLNLALFAGCQNAKPDNAKSVQKNIQMKQISKEEALAIARQDAETAYRDLSIYTVKAHKDNGNWVVDYELKDPISAGGGPHYLISAETGEILSKRYDQ